MDTARTAPEGIAKYTNGESDLLPWELSLPRGTALDNSQYVIRTITTTIAQSIIVLLACYILAHATFIESQAWFGRVQGASEPISPNLLMAATMLAWFVASVQLLALLMTVVCLVPAWRSRFRR